MIFKDGMPGWEKAGFELNSTTKPKSASIKKNISFPEITAQELKSKMNSGEKLLLINPLSYIEYQAKHIPGSVHIPLSNMLITGKLPKNKNVLIITYCLGPK